ncbi:MAG: hypothetical protein WCG91_03350 [Candidatus Shapirobacteria bacterium]
MKKYKLEKATIDDLYEISLMSARSKEKQLYIYEISTLSEIIGFDRAEILRSEFLKNGIKVKQITNNPVVSKFTKNDEFFNKLMDFRYVPKDIFGIRDEILIFDDMVAIYNTEPEIKLLVIKNSDFAENQKELFLELWNNSKKIIVNK